MTETADPHHITAPDETRDVIAGLVEHYRRNADQYRRASYKETRVRVEFVDPFFEALGWDIANEQGYAEPYKEVIHEDAIKVRGATRAPDYCFRIGGQRKFFLEAKKPSVHIKTDPSPAYQLRRYGWSAKLPLSILTDFEEFAVYDCSKRPQETDGPSVARVDFITYDEYVDRLDDIYSIFAKEAILKGSFDRYAEGTRRKRGTTEVDSEFLQEIEQWREMLAKDIARHNSDLSVHDLNFAVQTTIDRILFFRIAEDRGVEPYGRLRDLLDGAGLYPRLCQLYQQADTKYNAGLFDFSTSGDQLTPDLEVADKALQSILSELYYPQCPYEFSVIGADILGAVYEQFLGKVIRLTKGHQAKVEEKPEVKKAGGVYYTPTYIVDYIVEHTVGPALQEAKTPEAASKLRILDPACGSGSFLLGAYQYLLNWHLDYYTNHSPKKHTRGKQPAIIQVRENEWRLSTFERKRILLNNIYGVDIDPQAVEVTKLNLLLKCMEGETEETLSGQLQLAQERVLPNIDDNIKCGNSLIGPDYYEGRQLALLDDEESRRVNAFDWEAEFAEIMTAGGFDCVIGNPPWISLKGKFGKDILSNDERDYLIRKYEGDSYRPNVFEYFVKQAIELTAAGGIQSFIVPDRLAFNAQFASFRSELISSGHIVELLYKARFPYVIADTLIYRYRPGSRSEDALTTVGEFDGQKSKVRQSRFLEFQDCQLLPVTPLIDKLYFGSPTLCPLSELVSTGVGFIAKGGSITEEKMQDVQRPILRGRNVHAYFIEGQAYFEFSKENLRGGTQNQEKLGARPKILVRKTGFPLPSCIDETGRYPEQSLYFLVAHDVTNLKPLLGILNSRLFRHLYWHWMVTNRESTPQLKKIHLDQFPLPNPTHANVADTFEILSDGVESAVELHKRLAQVKTPRSRERLQRQITATDQAIDSLVYELYDLTEEEIAIIEGHNGPE